MADLELAEIRLVDWRSLRDLEMGTVGFCPEPEASPKFHQFRLASNRGCK